jgi:hypothetical protein
VTQLDSELSSINTLNYNFPMLLSVLQSFSSTSPTLQLKKLDPLSVASSFSVAYPSGALRRTCRN